MQCIPPMPTKKARWAICASQRTISTCLFCLSVAPIPLMPQGFIHNNAGFPSSPLIAMRITSVCFVQHKDRPHNGDGLIVEILKISLF